MVQLYRIIRSRDLAWCMLQQSYLMVQVLVVAQTKVTSLDLVCTAQIDPLKHHRLIKVVINFQFLLRQEAIS